MSELFFKIFRDLNAQLGQAGHVKETFHAVVVEEWGIG
jgi:hypothetical protein